MCESTTTTTQEEGHTGFFIHLFSAVGAFIFLARRIQPFLSLVDREVELRVRFNRSPPVGHFYFGFSSFFARKIPFAEFELTSQRVRGLRGTSELPGRPALTVLYMAFLCFFVCVLWSMHSSSHVIRCVCCVQLLGISYQLTVADLCTILASAKFPWR